MLSNHLILCRPLLRLPSVFPSIRAFSNGSALHIKYWSFSITEAEVNMWTASHVPMNIQGWFPLGLTGLMSLQSKELSSLLQHHNLKASILHHSAFFMIWLSHPYMTTRKTIALMRQTFVGKVMSLLFNMVSSFSPLTPGNYWYFTVNVLHLYSGKSGITYWKGTR